MSGDKAATQGFTLNHTMLRIKDPKASLGFYRDVLGMTLVRRLDFEEMRFSLYFLTTLEDGETLPDGDEARSVEAFSRRGILELTHNWGTEDDDSVSFHSGNTEPKGYGHICISVPDLDAAVAWLDRHKVEFVKRPEDGKMKDIAFIRDPDGYWIEIVEPARLRRIAM